MQLTVIGDDRTTVVRSDKVLRVLSWAPCTPDGPFSQSVHAIVNATQGRDEYVEADFAVDYCHDRLAEFGLEPERSVVLMTAVPQTYLQHEIVEFETTGLRVEVFCTAGMGNAVAPGDQALYDEDLEPINQAPGTINIIVVVNRALTDTAMLELIQVATMAKCQALFTLGQESRLSDRIALGTGTDCIALAGLAHAQQVLRFGGLSTKLGEAVSRAVSATVSAAVMHQRTRLDQVSRA